MSALLKSLAKLHHICSGKYKVSKNTSPHFLGQMNKVMQCLKAPVKELSGKPGVPRRKYENMTAEEMADFLFSLYERRQQIFFINCSFQ